MNNIGKLIKSIRFKLCNYYGEEVLILEQVKGYQRGYVIIGDRYIENTNNDIAPQAPTKANTNNEISKILSEFV